jgi:glycosyltransferase involved in cell wall biosynthesis
MIKIFFLIGIPNYVDKIIVIDDYSEDSTRSLVLNYEDERLELISLGENKGVGNAVKVGYKGSLQYNIDIVVAIGGDHQFDLEQLPSLLDPIVDDEADYVKGNRFLVDAKEVMPNKRYFGNIFLSMLTRMASGVRTIFDTQGGFIAVSRKVIESIDWDNFWHGYGFVSDFIIKIAAYGFRIKDVPIRAIYLKGIKQSQIVISRYIMRILPMILKGWLWKILHQRKLRKKLKINEMNKS